MHQGRPKPDGALENTRYKSIYEVERRCQGNFLQATHHTRNQAGYQKKKNIQWDIILGQNSHISSKSKVKKKKEIIQISIP